MDLVALKAELTTDPLTRGYAGMSDEQAANSLNGRNRTKDRGLIPTEDVIEAIAPAEYTALSAVQKDVLQFYLGRSSIRANSTNTKAALLALFGAGTATRASLATIAKEAASRAEEIGLGQQPVSPSDVADARRL